MTVHPRLLIIGLLVLVEVLWLLNVAVSAADAPEYEAYVVQANQTISSIADEYGIPAATIAQYNKLRIDAPLKAGSIIMVPISVQLAPQASVITDQQNTSSRDRQGTTTYAQSTGNKVSGLLAKVIAKKTVIRTQPNGGDVLFDNASKGMQLLVVNQTDTHYAVLMSDGSLGWVPRIAVAVSDTQMMVDRPQPTPQAITSNNAGGRLDLVDTAMEYLGIPYKYGGRLPDNVDCSLLIQTVYARHGISLPRTAAQQMTVGNPVAVSDLLPGDRLYFHERRGTRISHTGMYIGNGQFIHASSNRGAVAINEISDPTYVSIFAGARR